MSLACQARPPSAGQRKDPAGQAEEGGTAQEAGGGENVEEEDDDTEGRLADAVLLNEQLEQRLAQLTKQAGRMRRRAKKLSSKPTPASAANGIIFPVAGTYQAHAPPPLPVCCMMLLACMQASGKAGVSLLWRLRVGGVCLFGACAQGA
jgi:hypothetical protein